MKYLKQSVIVIVYSLVLLCVVGLNNKKATEKHEIRAWRIQYPNGKILKQTTSNEGKKGNKNLTLSQCIKFLYRNRSVALGEKNIFMCESTRRSSSNFRNTVHKTTTNILHQFTREILQNSFVEKLFAVIKAINYENLRNKVDVNKYTNFTSISLNREKRAASNYSGNNKKAAISDKITRINNSISKEPQKATRYISNFSRLISSTIYVKSVKAHTQEGITFENITKMSTRNFDLPQFLEVPKGSEMRIHELNLNEEYLLFGAFSSLIGYLQPSEFPLDLTRDSMRHHIPLHLLVYQILKLEGYVLIWILVWGMVTLCLPFAITAQLCCRRNKIQRLREDTSYDSVDVQERFTKNVLTILLHVLLIALLCTVVLMLWSNEQISRASSKCPQAAHLIMHDLNSFIENTYMQTSFVVTSSTENTIDLIKDAMENIDSLLGIPFQNKLAAETGVDITLSTVREFKFAATNISERVSDLMKDCGLARDAEKALQERLKELSKNLTLARSSCVLKDLSLCDTLQSFQFDVTFTVDDLMSEIKLRQLQHIGNDFSFNNSIEDAYKTFQDIPRRVALETAMQRSEITNMLYKYRGQIYESVRVMEDLSKSLSISLKANYEDFISGVVENVPSGDMWRWLTVLGASVLVFITWGLLLCGAPCGCGQTSRMIPCLLSGISVYCVVSFILWTLGSVSFLFGGHGKALLCRPLYDEPHYTVLSEILDIGEILYKDAGFFKTFIKGNETINFRDVLRDCQDNKPAYITFKLNGILDMENFNYTNWQDLNKALNKFTIKTNYLHILRPVLQQNLHELSLATTVNLTKFRRSISGAVITKDLNTFADQLNVVAKELSNLGSSKKMTNLAQHAKEIATNELRIVVDLRDNILYKLTALEILLAPFNRQINQSLSHLKTIQYFLDNQASKLAEKSSREYVNKITRYLENLQRHVGIKITQEISRCNPLWEVFNTTRFYICKLIVDPLNGYSFSCFSCILLFVCLTPVTVKLFEIYNEIDDEDFGSVTHRRARNGSIINEQSTWTTPRIGTPETEIGHIAPAEPAPAISWTTPGTRNDRSVYNIPPPPPREPPPETVFRTPSPRVAQTSSILRTRSPRRHESLRLIEQTTWRRAGLSPSPRNWI